MDELDKGLDVAIHGEKAERATLRALRQVESWGLKLPDVAPLVLDFGLGDFDRIGEVEFWIANEAAAGYCGKFIFVWTGQTCPKHMHKDKLETFFIVKGRVEMDHDGKVAGLKTGDVLRVPTGTYHRFTGLEPTLLLEVSKPTIIIDNHFEDERITIGRNAKHR
jgi:mannose-6-phosphate isomerase-like protein (cupin superfamily)